MSDWNDKVIEEFRANEGRVGGNFEGAPLLLLHSTGAKSGETRVHPMMYQAVDGGYAVFASKAGADSNPDWFYNLKAHPEASVEVGTETLDVMARVWVTTSASRSGRSRRPTTRVSRGTRRRPTGSSRC